MTNWNGVGSIRDLYESSTIFFRDEVTHNDSVRPDLNRTSRILSNVNVYSATF